MTSWPRLIIRGCLNRVADVIEWRYPDWNGEIAWRYLSVARLARQGVGDEGTILDVGAGGLGIAPFVANRCVLTDIVAPPSVRAPFVQASTTALPFTDGSFDAVVSADSLEHLPREEREGAIREMFRVARSVVIVAVPAGSAAEAQDRQLYQVARPDSVLRPFLKEHVDNGLPSEETLTRWVSAAAAQRFGKFTLRVEKNANLFLRRLMMRGIVKADDWGGIIRVRLWTPLVPLLARVSVGRCYRCVVMCRKEVSIQ